MTYIIWHRWFQNQNSSNTALDFFTFWFIWENTIESFQLALKHWADSIELDIHQCNSWELVVIHDETVDRTTDGHWSIQNLSLTEIKNLHTRNNQIIMTIDEVLNYVLEKKCMINIEVKWEANLEYIESLANSLTAFFMKWWSMDSILISSFETNLLLWIMDKLPWINTSLLVSHLTQSRLEYCKENWISAISPYSLVLYMMRSHFSKIIDWYSINLIPRWIHNKTLVDFFKKKNVYAIISDIWF